MAEQLNCGMECFYDYCVQLGDIVATKMGTKNPLDIQKIVKPIEDRNNRLREHIQDLEHEQASMIQQHEKTMAEAERSYKAAQTEYEDAAVPIIEELDYLGAAKMLYVEKMKKVVNRQSLHVDHFLLEEPQTYGYLAKGMAYFSSQMRMCFEKMQAGEPFVRELQNVKELELDEIPNLLDQLAEAAAVGLPSDTDVQKTGMSLVVAASNAALSHSQANTMSAPSLIESLHLATNKASAGASHSHSNSSHSDGTTPSDTTTHQHHLHQHPVSLTVAAENVSRAIAGGEYEKAAYALAEVSTLAERSSILDTNGDAHAAKLEEAVAECHRAISMKQAAAVTERYANALTLVKSYTFVEGMFGEQGQAQGSHEA